MHLPMELYFIKVVNNWNKLKITQLTFTCSRWTIETLEKEMKYVQSEQ